MKRPTRGQVIALIILVGIVSYIGAVAFLTPAGSLRSAMTEETVSEEGERPSYDRMMTLIEDGQVQSAYWYDYQLLLETTDGEKFTFKQTVGNVLSDVFEDLRATGVPVVFGPPPADSVISVSSTERLSAAFWELASYVVAFLPFVLLVFIVLFMRASLGGRSSSGTWPLIVRKHGTTFADVAGHGETRFELEELKTFIQQPDIYKDLGARPPKGVLMVGPPGTGKTLMAKALAGECGATFIAVSGSDFTSPFVGIGKGKVAKLFAIARKNAPAVIFIDEIDSLARVRGGDNSAASNEKDLMLNQLLVQMDGFEDNGRVFVIGATNRVDVLDPAILRPGRFDRQIHVGLPDRKGREEILAIHLRGKPLGKDVSILDLARSTPGFSGADIANFVNESAVHAGRAGKTALDGADFASARDKILLGVERRSSVLDAEDRRLVAVHEAGHAVAATLSPKADPVHQATIVPRGKSLGAVLRLPEKDRLNVPKAVLEADLIVLMAGRAAEECFFDANGVTTGAESDIEQATNIATRMVVRWGMSPLGMIRVERASNGHWPADVEQAIKTILDEAYAAALDLVRTHKVAVEALTEALLDAETLTGDEVRAIVGEEGRLSIAAE